MPNAAAESVSEELNVPAEIQRANAGASHAAGCVLAAIFVLFPAFVYFGFFGLLLVDAFVLETNYVSTSNVSPWVIEAIQVIYAPLIFLMNRIMNP